MTGRFAKVHYTEHEVFTGRLGGTTMRVWALLSRRAQTDPKTATRDRPLGHVLAGEEQLAKELCIGADTARSHLRRLSDAELIVLWREPVRGKVHLRADGSWGGLVAEYLVVPLATPEGLEAAERRRLERERVAAERQAVAARRGQGRRRATNGRYTTSDHSTTGDQASVATEAGTTSPTEARSPSLETLGLETVVDQTLVEGNVPDAAKAAAPGGGYTDESSNRPAYLAVVRNYVLSASLSERAKAGLADFLMDMTGGNVAHIQKAIDFATPHLTEDTPERDVRDVFCQIFDVDRHDYWDATQGRSWARAKEREGSA